MNGDMNRPDGSRERTELTFRMRRQREPAVQVVIGLIVVTIGVLFTLDNLHIVHANDYLRFWPAAFIAVGIAQFTQARTPGRRFTGILWMLLGAVLIANRLGYLTVRIWALWPLLLVVVGGRIFLQAFYRPGTQDLSPDADAAVSMVAVLGGNHRRIVSTAFQRAEVTAFMGGGKLDLRDATMAPGGAVIDVFAVMGGFEILVPPTWIVDVEGTPFMGGFDDKTQLSGAPGSGPHLKIRGFVMMGGVDIKNR